MWEEQTGLQVDDDAYSCELTGKHASKQAREEEEEEEEENLLTVNKE